LLLSARRTRSRGTEGVAGGDDRGVFGVPTMLLGRELWWGNDRLDFLEEFLKGTAAGSAPPLRKDEGKNVYCQRFAATWKVLKRLESSFGSPRP